MQTSVLFVVAALAANLVGAQAVLRDIPYYPAPVCTDAYQRTRCKLDLRLPSVRTNFATVVWFHGGGLTKGKKAFIEFRDRSVAQVAVNYRLSPQAEHPAYLLDAAAAVAWTFANIGRYGGDTNRIFVSGHSAGAYLTAMIGMDPRWLAPYGLKPSALAGLIPISGQMSTHFLVKKLTGDTGPQFRPIIDDFAPLHYAAADGLPPICFVTGDRRIEWPGRVEENEYLAASLRALGNKRVEFYELGGLNHGTAVEGAMPILREFIRRAK